MRAINLTGKRFGRLTVIERAENNKYGKIRCLCQCDCGVQLIVEGGRLKSGNTASCGCYKKEIFTKHGQAAGKRTSEYQAWGDAKDRCFNSNNRIFKHYGGRGVTMCPEWRDSFEAFFAYMGPRPAGMTLDRFPDNDGNYEPGNVRWATWSEQNLNKKRSIK